MNRTILGPWVFFGALSFLLLTTGCSDSPKAGSAEKVDYRMKQYAQEITCENKSLSLTPGQSIEVPITVKNLGSEVWMAHSERPVRVGYHLFANGTRLPIEGERAWLPVDLTPGVVQPVTIKVTAPPSAGQYILKFTMVHEGVTWFSDAGAKTCDVNLNVQ